MFKILSLVLVLLLALPTWASAGMPEQMDWSLPNFLLGTLPTSQTPPIVRDDEGNFHIVWNEFGELVYIVTSPQGEVLTEIQLDLPGFERGAPYTGIPVEDGLKLVWGQVGSDGNWLLNLSKISLDGDYQTTEIDYQLPPHSSLQDMFRLMGDMQGAMDSKGNIHLVINGGIARFSTFFYFVITPQGKMEHVEILPSSGSGGFRLQFPGQLQVDNEDNVHILTAVNGVVNYFRFGEDGRFGKNLGRTIAQIQGEPNTPYLARSIPPAMALDEDGVVHIAWNHLTLVSLGITIIDVKYLRIDGDTVMEKIITGEDGIAHFPTITTHRGKVYVSWEEGARGTQEVFFKVLDAQDGSIIGEKTRFTWEQSPSRLGMVFGNDDENLTAFWWQSASPGTRLVVKSTHNPVEPSFWHKAGLITHDPDNSVASQIVYYLALIFLLALGQVAVNFTSILWILAGLFVLFKLGLLDRLLERPWLVLGLCFLVLFFTVTPIQTQDALFELDEVFYLYSVFIATAFSFGFLRLINFRPNSTINLVFGSLFWIFTLMLIQLTPMVPHQFVM